MEQLNVCDRWNQNQVCRGTCRTRVFRALTHMTLAKYLCDLCDLLRVWCVWRTPEQSTKAETREKSRFTGTRDAGGLCATRQDLGVCILAQRKVLICKVRRMSNAWFHERNRCGVFLKHRLQWHLECLVCTWKGTLVHGAKNVLDWPQTPSSRSCFLVPWGCYFMQKAASENHFPWFLAGRVGGTSDIDEMPSALKKLVQGIPAKQCSAEPPSYLYTEPTGV